MKKKLMYVIIGLVVFIILAIFLVCVFNTSDKHHTRRNSDYVATIYHSVMIGMDAGTEYMYYIYKSSKNDNNYFFVKTNASITLNGPTEEHDVDSDYLKSKADLEKITNDIENDYKDFSQSYIKYTYIDNGVLVNCETIEDLGNLLFK